MRSVSYTHLNYDVETIEATCTTYGCIKHTCLNCGDTYETDVRTALGHKSVSYTHLAKKNEEKINARGMVKQLAVGIIVMFVLAMGTPLVINGLSHWVTW